jgi:hypothetical protein
MGRPATTSAAGFGPLRTHAHIAVDQHANGVLPGRNLLVGHAFAAIFIQLGLQHFVHFIVLGRDPTRFALGPPTRGGRRWAIDFFHFFEVIFQIRIIVIGTARSRCRTRGWSGTWCLGTFIATTTTAAAATTTRSTIFATFAVARSQTGGAIFVGCGIFLDRRQFGVEIVVGIGVRFGSVRFVDKWFAGWRVEIIDGTRRTGRGFFFIATTTTTTATAARTTFPFFIGGTIKAETLFASGCFFALTRRDEIVLKMFGCWLLLVRRLSVSLWLPIFGNSFAKTTAGWRSLTAWWTAFAVAPVIATAATATSIGTSTICAGTICIGSITAASFDIARITTAFSWTAFCWTAFGLPAVTPFITTATTISFWTIAIRAFTLTRRWSFCLSTGRRGKQICRQIVGD